ncbi:MAG: M14 family zinc carboxypeptidase [Bacteroidota bacterium]|nr:M14 family zinc carboxypeptidase [Bacteroidota bacterium]MDP3145310.1 M14 family zinc carboxypeptidase [Bacteroidota bacterium]
MMIKKIILSVLVLFCLTTINSQTLKYHKVLMQGDESLAKKLLQLGITIDHSDVQDGGIAAEISDYELQTLKANGVKHKILIYDLANFYEARNKADVAERSMPINTCNAPNIIKPTNFHLGTMGGYFTWNEMKQILDSMVLLYPNLITVKQPLSFQSIEGKDIYFVKISDNPNIDEPEPEVLYSSLHHAREAASLSQLIFYMWYLLENYATNPDIKATLDNTELYFVPCVNPDGYVYNQTTNPNGGGMWRKNRRDNLNSTFGVDLNRNYGDHWGFDNTGSSPNSSSDTYRGASAFSEPETQAMRDFCNSRQFVTALNAHTYSNLLIYPWGYLPSLYTPDSAVFVNWSVLLTEDSRFLYGTGDQTVNYVVNGDSDDWMYGEQTTKPKILAMTPEAGSATDGFWPASSRILDICKTTFTQNYNLAKLAGKYAIARDAQDKFLSGNGYIKYNLQRLGLQAGTFTVSISPVGTDISAVGVPKIYSTLVQNQTILDSISFILNTGLVSGQIIKYAIAVNNGAFTRLDTVSKIYGSPITLIYDNGSSTATNYTTSGTWGLSTTKFVSPPNSITDSPNGNYSGNQTKSITLKNPAVLTNAVYAHLQYYTRFELEKNGDKTQIFITTNNGVTWTPLCGKYETSPVSFGGTNPIYDGFQDAFVKEDIDLSLYIGQTIKLRFLFNTDFSVNKDGFYFDDLWIRVIASSATSLNQNILVGENIILSPNPSKGLFNLSNPNGIVVDVAIFNSLGQIVYQKNNENSLNSIIDIENQSAGIYFVKIRANGEEIIKKVIVSK